VLDAWIPRVLSPRRATRSDPDWIKIDDALMNAVPLSLPAAPAAGSASFTPTDEANDDRESAIEGFMLHHVAASTLERRWVTPSRGRWIMAAPPNCKARPLARVKGLTGTASTKADQRQPAFMAIHASNFP
jgi:hypothetical protein